MTKEEIEKIVKTTYDTVIKGPAGECVNMEIPDLNASMTCLSRVSGRMIQVGLETCWLNLESWKLDRETIIRTITNFLWMMMK